MTYPPAEAPGLMAIPIASQKAASEGPPAGGEPPFAMKNRTVRSGWGMSLSFIPPTAEFIE